PLGRNRRLPLSFSERGYRKGGTLSAVRHKKEVPAKRMRLTAVVLCCGATSDAADYDKALFIAEADMPAVAVTKSPQAAPHKDLYDIGEIPPLGHVPAQMHAWAIRKERHGPPEKSMQLEVLPTWPIGEDEVLVLVMAGGVNYNGVWAGLGVPISPLDVHKNPFHIAGSDASGIVW